MAAAAVSKKMLYCPKCQETYEEGSRRFCANDGGRLVLTSTSGKTTGSTGGVFANLLPATDVNAERDAKLAALPKFVPAEQDDSPVHNVESSEEAEFYYIDLDEIELELEPEQTPESEAQAEAAAASKPMARLIRPDEIPTGHAEIGDRHSNPIGRPALNWDDPDALIGNLVKGRYRIIDLLRQDDDSIAYLAEDKIVPEKKVEVRILLEEEYGDDLTDKIYAEERVALSHLYHPYVVSVIDSGELPEGNSFIVTEHIDAGSVQDILQKNGQFNTFRTARIIRQASYALSEVHQNGILHRNLKPEDIILTVSENGTEQVKLTNFGVSGSRPSMGNLAYKAPEILEGEIATFASDIYSLAVIAYQMLTSRLPFEGSKAQEILKAQRGGLKTAPTEIRVDLPKSADEILKKAMELDPAERYPKARDFGDAFFHALTAVSPPPISMEGTKKIGTKPRDPVKQDEPKIFSPPPVKKRVAKSPPLPNASEGSLKPIAEDPAWTRRSPEPPKTEGRPWILLSLITLIGLLAGFWGWVAFLNVPAESDIAVLPDTQTAHSDTNTSSPTTGGIEAAPLPRNIPQPPNTAYFQNNKQNLRGDLVRNFLGFSIYYPSDWQITGPQESWSFRRRGKFLDIRDLTPEGQLKEQMLVSYYRSKGTYKEDAGKFPQLVKETNDTLKKLIPNYQTLSEGEITFNGGWKAYEIRFQGGGTTDKGENLIVWGRRLFVPAARQGGRNGFEITMLATSFADDVKSVDDVGVKGDLAAILYSFEPSPNF